jgi:hypothetical protein
MESSKNTKRKNFRCVFNHYVTKENEDAIIRSIISQFEGYYAEPEVTVTDDGFIITLTIGDNLSASSVRDKILWNQFVDSVTTQDAIRKIQIIRLPKAGLMDFGGRIDGKGSVGGFGPNVDPIVGDTGVDEIMFQDGEPIPHKEYKIDMKDRPDGPRFSSWVKQSDPTDAISEGQSFVKGLTPEDLSSDVTNLESEPTTELESGKRQPARVFNAFKVIAIDSDTGDSFSPTWVNKYNDTLDGADLPSPEAPRGNGGFLPKGNWYNTNLGNERGTMTGVESEKRGDESSAAPFAGITGSIQQLKEPEIEDVESAIDIPQARGGAQSVPDGGQVEGWFASAEFGINETYDYEGDVDDNYL